MRQFSEGILSAAQSDHGGVRRILRELKGDPRYSQRALLHHLVGERDAMYAMFERAVSTRDGDVLWILNAVPYLEPLRQEPKYRQLLAKIGLPEGGRAR